MDAASLDVDLRKCVYDITVKRGLPPMLSELVTAAGMKLDDVRAGLARLADAHVLVVQPASGEILMAPPFSAVPTPFVVQTRLHQSYANCAWDALGVSVMLHEPAQIISACGCCGEAISIHTRMRGRPHGDSVMHFAVPAMRWWEDIVFT
jgi:hypothetical protein